MQVATAAQQRTGAQPAHDTFLPPKFCLANSAAGKRVEAASHRGDPRSWARILTTAVKLHTAAAKSLQSCPTLCDPIDGSPPGSPIPGILQARTLEWAAISFSSA